MDSPPLRSVDATVQRDALTRRLHRRSIVKGQITLPAVPGMIDEYELATQCLEPGGRLVFDAFLAKPGYAPDDAARELGQQCYTTIFTPQELSSAASCLPLQLVSDDSEFEYVKS